VRRLALLSLIAAGMAAFVLSTGASNGPKKPTYEIVFDNASGLVELADFRVGGVAVGRIESFDVYQRSRAKVEVSVSDTSFGRLREDAFCKIAQQSLIGEYYIECEPGTKGKPLPNGATIPLKQTASPIAADLVNNIMRRPYRERLTILLSELGAGFASRGEDINETIRRGVPAIRETNKVLKILADNRTTLRRLAADSGEVLKVLGDRRKDVSRFVSQAGETASVTAERREELAETFRRFPGFLREFSPTLRDLGTASREFTPALADLRAASPSVVSLLNTLPPFARASEPAVTSLASASELGRTAVGEAESTVELLGTLGQASREPANNLKFVTRDLDDRGRAVEKDPDSPGGQGYTGLEAILQYPFDQSLAINIFDTRGYILKLSALVNECTAYTDAQEAKADPERTKRCSSMLGPNQPGVTTPDPTGSGGTRAATRTKRSRGEKDGDRSQSTPEPAREDAPAPQPGGKPQAPQTPVPDLELPELLDKLPDLLGNKGPAPKPQQPPIDLLDFLMGS
jgi:virulence factor Mce-like protein